MHIQRRRVSRRALLVMATSLAYASSLYLVSDDDVSHGHHFKDVAYGKTDWQIFDIFLPAGSGPFPFVVDVHGGAVTTDSTAGTVPIGGIIASGVAVVRVSCGQSLTGHWPMQLEDCLQAIRHVVARSERYKLDPARFALGGASVGAILAVSVALSLLGSGTEPRAVLSLYPSQDIQVAEHGRAEAGERSSQKQAEWAGDEEKQEFGYLLGENPQAQMPSGPVAHLEGMSVRRLPSLFSRYSESDPEVSFLQSLRLKGAWARVDPTALIDFGPAANAGHDVPDHLVGETREDVVTFLVRSLAP